MTVTYTFTEKERALLLRMHELSGDNIHLPGSYESGVLIDNGLIVTDNFDFSHLTKQGVNAVQQILSGK